MIRAAAIGVALFPLACFADPGMDLLSEVIATGRVCAFAKGVTDRQECYVKASPERCEREARAGVMGNSMLFAQLRACIISCGNAGAWSSTVGECSRSIVIKDAPQRLARLAALRCENESWSTGWVRAECLEAAEGR